MTLTCKVCHKQVPADSIIRFGGNHVCGACKPLYIETLNKQDAKRLVERNEGDLWFWLCVFFYMGAMAWIVCTAPKFRRMYDEMLAGEPLSRLTVFVCSIPSIGYAVAAAISAATIIAFYFSTRSEAVRRKLRLSMALFTVLLLIVYIYATFSPLFISIDGRLG